MASKPEEPKKPRQLALADLKLSPNDFRYADGVACVKAYWSQATIMSADYQMVMIEMIKNHDYAHTMSSLQGGSNHKLYHTAMKGPNDCAYPVFLIIRAMYKVGPKIFMDKARHKFPATTFKDLTNEYLAWYPETIQIASHIKTTLDVEAFTRTYPKVRNIPAAMPPMGEEQTQASRQADALPIPTLKRQATSPVSVAKKPRVWQKHGEQSPALDEEEESMEFTETMPAGLIKVPRGQFLDNYARLQTGTPKASTLEQRPVFVLPSSPRTISDEKLDRTPRRTNSQRSQKFDDLLEDLTTPAAAVKGPQSDVFDFEAIMRQLEPRADPISAPTAEMREISKLRDEMALLQNQMRAFMMASVKVINSLKEDVARLKTDVATLKEKY